MPKPGVVGRQEQHPDGQQQGRQPNRDPWPAIAARQPEPFARPSDDGVGRHIDQARGHQAKPDGDEPDSQIARIKRGHEDLKRQIHESQRRGDGGVS